MVDPKEKEYLYRHPYIIYTYRQTDSLECIEMVAVSAQEQQQPLLLSREIHGVKLQYKT